MYIFFSLSCSSSFLPPRVLTSSFDPTPVLYQDVDEDEEIALNFGDDMVGPEPNAYEIQVDPSKPVRAVDLHRHFPLSRYDDDAQFIFRTQDSQGCFLDLTNPGQIVPRLGPYGSVVCKVFRSPVYVPPPREEDVLAELRKRVPTSYFDYKKNIMQSKKLGLRRPTGLGAGSADALRRPSGLPSGSATSFMGNFMTQENIDERLESVKEGAKHMKDKFSSAVQSIDDEKIKKQTKKLVKGMKGLWKNFRASTANIVDDISGHVGIQQSLTVCGSHTVRIQSEIAEGGFSVVYLAKDETQNFALKKMICQTKESRSDAMTEIKTLRMLQHPNIISLVDHDVTDGGEAGARGTKVYMLLFHFIESTCYSLMEKNIQNRQGFDPMNVGSYGSPFEELDALEIILGCSSALGYMHEEFNICHRDFKPHNVLLRYDGRGHLGGPTPVVMDLGSVAPAFIRVETRSDALNIEEEAEAKSSAPYRCPELTSVSVGSIIDAGSDMWSLGCTMFALAFGYCPFETPREGVMKLGILNGSWRLPRSATVGNFSQGYKSLIGKLLSAETNDRGTAADCAEECNKLLRVFRS